MYSVDGAKNVDTMDTWPLHMILDVVQGSANRRTLGLDNFLPAVDYHFCPTLHAAFTQPGASTLANL